VNDFAFKSNYIQEHRNELVKRIGAGIAEKLGDEKLQSEIYRVSDALLAFIESMDTGGNAIVPLALDLTFLRVMMELTDVVQPPVGEAN
jgi:hypothetical protein